jgi:nucleoside-diphosphate-sugar epimerase
MRRVVLTGATGFVGRHLLAALRDRGAQVAAVVRTGSSLPDGVECIYTTDAFAESLAWWQEHLTGADALVHAAWVAEPGNYLEHDRNWDCLSGTLTIARAAALAGVARVVGIGTCLEYDLSGGILDTHTPLRPETPYAAAKAAAFLALSQLLPRAGVSFAWARLFYLFGDGEDPRRLVPYLHARLSAALPAELTEGRQVRDYLNVRQAAEMLARLVEGGPEGAVNVCSGEPVTVRDLATAIARSYGREDLLRFGAKTSTKADPERVLGIPTRWS